MERDTQAFFYLTDNVSLPDLGTFGQGGCAGGANMLAQNNLQFIGHRHGLDGQFLSQLF